MPDPTDDLFGMPPLDLGETLGPQAPPPSAPSARARAKEYAPLLALLPLIARSGGRVGVAALLNGFQQARAQSQQTERQAQMDAERQRQIQEQERYRRDTLAQTTANNEATRRQAFMRDFNTGLESLDTPEAVNAFLALQRQQAQAIGLRPDALDAVAMEYATPTRLEKKEATKVIEQAKKQYGDQAVNNTYTLRDGTQANWEELNRRAGVGLGAPAPAKADVPNTLEEQQVADALAVEAETLKRPLTRAEAAKIRQQVHQQWAEAGRKPDAPAPAPSSDPRVNARIDRIVTSFNSHPLVKEFNEVQAQQGIIQRVVDGQWSGPGDMAAIFAFMKAMDPSSVVRETEYANAAKSGNIFMGWAARFNGALSPNGGFLSPQVKQDFLRTINARLLIKMQQYQNLRKQLVERVDRIKAGAPETGDEALVDYSSAMPPGQRRKVGRFEILEER